MNYKLYSRKMEFPPSPTRKWILFGPPGVGKSTLCRSIWGALDLESVSQERRLETLISSDCHIFGAADVNPATIKRAFGNAFKDTILFLALRMPQAKYEARRKNRDADEPGKGSQPEMRIADFTRGMKHVVDVDGPIQETVETVTGYIDEFEQAHREDQPAAIRGTWYCALPEQPFDCDPGARRGVLTFRADGEPLSLCETRNVTIACDSLECREILSLLEPSLVTDEPNGVGRGRREKVIHDLFGLPTMKEDI